MKLKSENDSAKASLASAQENIQALIQENENLKLSNNVRWFVAGAPCPAFRLVPGMGYGQVAQEEERNLLLLTRSLGDM